ncbi:carbohydrate-binding module family 13 protein [Thozetella sp. PMI_491]|nr:carbohydrate-binding module family 13 protein [Thozetella sp. PMI_491]
MVSGGQHALSRLVAATTFLNHAQLLSGLENPDWFEQNIPLLDVPDSQVQSVYYYRWASYKEHLVYSSPEYGYLVSEFLQPAGYGAPFGGIVAAAGHHISEGRWLRNQQYIKDAVNYWLAGPGQFSKTANYDLNPDTHDWAHEYSFWAASSVWRQYLVTGDKDFVIGQLDNLVKQYRNWDDHLDSSLGLYWQAPVWDASEYTAASFESSDAYHGGYGFRPTINAYQYGDARAISAIATLKGDSALADEYRGRADTLQSNMQRILWDSSAQFFKHRQRDNNPNGVLLSSREIMGYVPWMFNMPQASDNVAFSQLLDPQGFSSNYGPTTVERRSQWFMYKAISDGCCHWDGPSWPFATAQTLTAVENVLNDYPAQSCISAADYFTLLKRYVLTQFKAGVPYVAEAHDPDSDTWIYDGVGHSEDYNHSTFVDNIIAGLIGVRAQANDTLVVNPLAPSTWAYFALENLAYHGHTVTILWDSTGSHYGQGKGLRVWVDGNLAGNRDTLGPLTVSVGSVITQALSTQVNIAVNTQQDPFGTTPFASYTSVYDNVWRAVDGMVYRNSGPENTRWTSYQSPNAQDYFGLDLRRTQAVSDVRLYFYDDGGGVQRPSSYDLQYWTGSAWTTVPSQTRSGSTATSNTEIKITFPTLMTSQLRVVAPNKGGGTGWGLAEFQVWAAPIFQFRNVNSGKLMGVDHMLLDNGAKVQQYEDNGTRDHLWKFLPQPGGWYKIQNLNSGKLLAVTDMSTANSVQIWQYEDNGTADHLWRVEYRGSGQWVVRNKWSNKVLGVDGMSTANSANVVQFDDSGTADHLWNILAAVPAS